MRRDDFVIDDIPDGFQIYDVDLSPKGQPVAILRRAPENHTDQLLFWGSTFVPLAGPLGTSAIFPQIRAIDENEVIVVDSRSRSRGTNAWILSEPTGVRCAFSVGDGIQDVLASKRWIITTYFDEGVFSGLEPGREGLAFYDKDGDYQFGYHSKFTKDGVDIVDCYCACWSGTDQLAFFSYGEPNFPLIQINLSQMSHEMWAVPDDLHGANALTLAADIVYFYSPYDRPSTRPTGLGDQILAWQIGTLDFVRVGEHPRAERLRGLTRGRFIASKPDGYTILSFE